MQLSLRQPAIARLTGWGTRSILGTHATGLREMKTIQMGMTLVLCAALLSGGASAAGERPAPSRHLVHAFQMFLLLEEKVEHLEWDAAAGIGGAVRAECLRLSADLRAAAGEKTVDEFLFEFGSLLKEIEARDLEGSLASYRGAEQSLFDIVDAFDFRFHPVFAILDAEVHEALESVRQGHLNHAREEIAEIAVYFRTARGILDGEGGQDPELESFDAAIARAAESAAGGDADGAEAALAGLAEQASKLITRALPAKSP